MKVFAKILAILAVLLVLVSLVSVVFTAFFQVQLVEARWGGGYAARLARQPAIPVGDILACLVMFVCTVPMVILAGEKHWGAWGSILLVVIMIVAVPVVRDLGNFVYWMIIRGYKYADLQSMFRRYYWWFHSVGNGTDLYAYARFAIYELVERSMQAADFAQILMYITCGLSMGTHLAHRAAKKRTAKAVAEAEERKEEEV